MKKDTPQIKIQSPSKGISIAKKKGKSNKKELKLPFPLISVSNSLKASLNTPSQGSTRCSKTKVIKKIKKDFIFGQNDPFYMTSTHKVEEVCLRREPTTKMAIAKLFNHHNDLTNNSISSYYREVLVYEKLESSIGHYFVPLRMRIEDSDCYALLYEKFGAHKLNNGGKLFSEICSQKNSKYVFLIKMFIILKEIQKLGMAVCQFSSHNFIKNGVSRSQEGSVSLSGDNSGKYDIKKSGKNFTDFCQIKQTKTDSNGFKLFDFGAITPFGSSLSQILTKKLSQEDYLNEFYVPESGSSSGIVSKFTDSYLYGLLLLKILEPSTKFPSCKKDYHDLIDKVKSRAGEIDPELSHLLTRCLEPLPGDRMSVDQIQKHPFFVTMVTQVIEDRIQFYKLCLPVQEDINKLSREMQGEIQKRVLYSITPTRRGSHFFRGTSPQNLSFEVTSSPSFHSNSSQRTLSKAGIQKKRKQKSQILQSKFKKVISNKFRGKKMSSILNDDSPSNKDQIGSDSDQQESNSTQKKYKILRNSRSKNRRDIFNRNVPPPRRNLDKKTKAINFQEDKSSWMNYLKGLTGCCSQR